MEFTARLSLPTLAPGQAQKEIFHNEALQLLDCVVAGAIEEPARNDPPQSPAPGQSFLVGDAPTGEWSQYSAHIACYASGGWRFVAPVIGLAVLDKSSGSVVAFTSTGWEIGIVRASRVIVDGQQVLGSQVAAIGDPAGGANIDSEARSAIGEILSALRQHGLISS